MTTRFGPARKDVLAYDTLELSFLALAWSPFVPAAFHGRLQSVGFRSRGTIAYLVQLFGIEKPRISDFRCLAEGGGGAQGGHGGRRLGDVGVGVLGLQVNHKLVVRLPLDDQATVRGTLVHLDPLALVTHGTIIA